MESVALPVNNRPEREQLYQWIIEEEKYAENKYVAAERAKHDASLQAFDPMEVWIPYVNQYYDRAKLFLKEAHTLSLMSDPESAERRQHFEQMALQAIAKALMTAKGFAESAIRVYGEMPLPGVSSGNIEKWHPRCSACGELIDLENEKWWRAAGSSEIFHDGECG